MATLKQRLADPGYENWLKAGLSLLHLREGLKDFVESETRALHSDILTTVFGASGHVTQCKTCTSSNIRQKNGFWGISCSSKICNDILREILNHHVSPKSKGITWRNSDVQRWTTDVWEVAKCYMSPLDDANKKLGVQDTDVSAIMNLIIHCQWFHRKISANFGKKSNAFLQVRDYRNEIMHSLDMKLTSTRLTEMTDSMIALLEDPAHIVTLTQAKQAVINIKQLRSSSKPISTADELKVVQTKMKTVEERLDKTSQSLKESTDSLKDDQTLLFGKMGDLRLEIASSESRTVEQMKNCLKTVEDVQTELEIKMKENTSVKEEIRTLKDRMDSNPSLESVQQNCKKLESSCSDLEFELHQAQNNYGSLGKKVESVLETIADLGSQIESVDARITSTEERLANVEITVNTSVGETTEADCTELRRELIEIYQESYSDIPVSPLFEDEVVELKHVFSPVVILEENGIGGRGQRNLDKRLVKGYRDIFYKGKQKMKKIYLRGKAGYGKTTWCYHMLNTWCNAQSKLTSGDQLSDDEISLSEFDFLFFVSLRLTNEYDGSRSGKGDGQKLHQAICNQLFGEHSKFEQTVLYVLKNCPERTLVLLDGLDESDVTSNFLSRKHFRGTTTICTTRPWKFESLHLKPSEVDLILELDGLDEEGVETLASSILTAFHGMEDMESIKQCKSALRLSNMTALLKIPLILIFMVHNWYTEEKLASSLTENFMNIIECLLQRGIDKISDQDQILTQWDKVAMFLGTLPNQFNGREMCNKFALLIQILGRLALEGLLSEKKEGALVFSQKSLTEKVASMLQEASSLSGQNLTAVDKKNSISAAECLLDISLRVGILSKTKVPSALKRESLLTFMHKSVQEFLAAVWIVASKNSFTFRDLCLHCDSLEKTLDMANVLPFICGLSPELGVQLSDHIATLSSRDSDMIKYRSKLSGDNTKVVSLTDLMISCKTETENSGTEKHISLRVDDLSLGFMNSNLEPDTVFDMIESNQTNLRSLQFYCFDSSGVVGYVLWKTLYGMEDMAFVNLCRFELELVGVPGEAVNENTDAIQTALPNLNVLKVDVLGTTDREVALDLARFTQLEAIHFGVQLTKAQWQQFSDFLLGMRQLTNLVLYAADLYDVRLDLSNLLSLKHLRLEEIEMSRSTWKLLHDSITILKSLEHLHITGVNFHESKECSSDICMLHLTGLPDLRELSLTKTLLDSILLDLKGLQDIWLYNLVLSEEVEIALLSSLQNSSDLKTLAVHGPRNVKCVEVLMDATKTLTNLRDVRFYHTDFCEFLPDLSHLALLETLVFSSVTMKAETESFISEMLQSMTSIRYFEVTYMDNLELEHVVVPPRFNVRRTEMSNNRLQRCIWEQV